MASHAAMPTARVGAPRARAMSSSSSSTSSTRRIRARGVPVAPLRVAASRASSPRASTTTTTRAAATPNDDADVVVIGSGVGGLTAAAMLAYYGKKVLVLESHYATGGAAHGFARKTAVGEFRFDTGPSFFAGLTTPNALNPLAAVLTLLGEPLETVKYDPLGTFHMEKGKPGLRRHADLSKLVAEVERFSPQGAKELSAAVPKIRTMYDALSQLPTPALRADWKVGIMIVSRYMKGASHTLVPIRPRSRGERRSLRTFPGASLRPGSIAFNPRPRCLSTPTDAFQLHPDFTSYGMALKAMAGLGPYAPVLPNPTVGLLDFLGINDPWMRRLADLECYLLSGVDASGTVAAEFAAVFGASDDLKQSEVRSIHWSPYDRVGVVNADP